MLRLLFTTEDNSKQLTVITDGIDSQLNVFVTEDVVGDIDYFKSLGIVVEPGHTYNIGKFKEWAFDAKLILISYPEGLNEKSVILQDIQEDWRYTFETSTPELNFPATGGNEEYVITSGKQLYINGEAQGEIESVELTVVVNGSGFAAQADTTVSATQNPTEAERRGTLVATQKESNKQINDLDFIFITSSHPINKKIEIIDHFHATVFLERDKKLIHIDPEKYEKDTLKMLKKAKDSVLIQIANEIKAHGGNGILDLKIEYGLIGLGGDSFQITAMGMGVKFKD